MERSEVVSFILKIFSTNKRAKEFKDDFITAFIEWIEPVFLKEDKSLLEKLKNDPQAKETQDLLSNIIAQKLEDPDFKRHLEKFIDAPEGKALRRKNIFEEEIDSVEGNFRIGDTNKAEDPSLDEKNIFKGKIGKIKGDFRIGDD